ncbi:hypothetical protein MRS44_004112 [Fusarium solani]|uniref:uncharacterized protein n=1 Tax=Fusarium solani TaxID=169388 RepID=UPI0032C4590F|nr:hypothetical protein MRS44_004112 [Fusarium solani]
MSAVVRLLAGKTAAITGGTTGIGRAITLEYLRQGANVAVNHLGLSKDEPLRRSLVDEAKRLSSEAPEGAPTGQLLEIAGDVTDPETGKALVAEAVKRWGALDVFVANAGIFKANEFLDIEKETFDKSMKVNVNGAFYACQAAARQMVKQGNGGSIIGISSISALVGGGFQVHYTPTKAALLSMTQSMAIALAKDKIRVNALLPGTIHTQLADADMANEEKRKYLEHRIPWGRVGNPEDLAGPAVFLACDKMSGFVTGAQLLVDGGMLFIAPSSDFPIDVGKRRPSTSAGIGEIIGSAATYQLSPYAWTTTRNLVASPEADCHAGKACAGLQAALAEDTTQTEGDQANQGSPSATQASSPPSGDNQEGLQPSDGAQEEDQAPETESVPREAAEHGLDDCQGYSVLEDVLELSARDPGLSSTTQGDATSWQMGCEAMVSSGSNLGTQNCYTFQHAHPEMLSPTQAAFQTAALAYHSTPDSGVNHGNGSLTLRWLDLLIGDATLNYGPLPELEIGPDVFGNAVTQTPTSLDEAATPATNDSSGVTTQSAYLQERLPDRRGPSGDKQLWQASEAIALQPQEHILFRHFTEHISRWMDLFEPQRPFGTLVPHLALHNIGLMNAVLALSARHLRIVNSDSPCHAAGYRPDPNDTIRYYWKTLHYSQKAMKYETYQTSLELLASAIIISSYEMLDGASTDWEKHLKGVFWIQRSQVIHGDSGGLRQAVWWAWLCQDVWAAFREKRKPFTFWQPTRSLAELDPNHLAARAVYNFAHIVGFCAEESEPGNATLNTQKAALLLQRLETWKSYLTVEFNPLPGPDSENNKDFPLLWIQPAAFGKHIIALC